MPNGKVGTWFTSDGHPNDIAHELIAREIFRVLEEKVYSDLDLTQAP